MESFGKREKAFEDKFAHDAETRFKIEARAARAVAIWAAALLGKSDEQTAIYIGEVIAADFKEAGQDDLIEKVSGDLTGIKTVNDVRAQLAAALEEAHIAVTQG